MPKLIARRIIRPALTCLLLALACNSGCGSGNPFAQSGSRQLQPRDMSRAELLQDIAQLDLPGLDATKAAELRTEFARMLASGSQTRWLSTPPRGIQNTVSDLQLLEAGAEGRSLSWSYRNSGDYDLNGEANISDLGPLGQHLNKTSNSTDWELARRADGDGNGVVSIADLTPIGANLLGQVTGYRILGAENAEEPLSELAVLPVSKELLAQSTTLLFELPDGPWLVFAVEPLDAAGANGARSNLCGAGISLEQFPGSPGSSVNDNLPQIDFPRSTPEALIETASGLPLVGNRIGVLFAPTATVADGNALLALLGASVIGSDPFTGAVLLEIPPAADTAALASLLEQARGSNGVQLACCDIAGIGTPDASEDYPTADEHQGSSLRELPPARYSFTYNEFGVTFPDVSYGACFQRWGIENVRAPQGWNLRTYGQRQGKPPEALVIDEFAEFQDDWYGDIDLRDGPGLVFKPVDPNRPPRPYDTHGSQVAEILGANWWNQRNFESINPLQPTLDGVDLDMDGELIATLLNAYSYVFAKGLAQNPELVVVNNSWGMSKGFAKVENAEWMDPLGDLFHEGAARFEQDHRGNFLVCSAAGYDGDKTGTLIPYDSVFSNVAVRYPDGHFICCELIDDVDEFTEKVKINLGGTVSAPGYEMPYSGTSFSTPMVSSLVSYLWALDPDLSWQQVRTLITGEGYAVPTTGGTRPRIDAYNAVMGIDKIRGGKAIQRAMVDVDDGTADGQERINPFDGTIVTGIATADGQRGDGLTTMRDFRAWRDAYLDVETSLTDKQLDGPALHFKRDLNFNGVIGGALADPPHPYSWNESQLSPNPGEHVYSRYDFNGDGLLDLQPALVNGQQLTDLQLLTDIEIWQLGELNGYDEGVHADAASEGESVGAAAWQPSRFIMGNRDAEGSAPQALKDLPDYLHSFDLHLQVDFSAVPGEIQSLQVSVATELWPDGIDNNGVDGVDEPFEQVFERTALFERAAVEPVIVTLPLWTGQARIRWDSQSVEAPLAGSLTMQDLKFGEDRAAKIPNQEWYLEDQLPAWQGMGSPGCAVIAGKPALVCGSFSLGQVLYKQAADSRAFGWNTASTVLTTGNVPFSIGLVDCAGVPGVALLQSKTPGPGHRILFIRGTDAQGTAWEAAQELAINDTGEAALEALQVGLIAGRPAISFVRRLNSGEETLEYAWADNAGGTSWPAPVVARPLVEFLSLTGMTDISGRPGLLFIEVLDDGSGYEVLLLRGATAAGGFGNPVPVGTGIPRAFASINGTPAYLTTTSTSVTYRRAQDPDGQSWGAPVVFPMDNSGSNPSVFLLEVLGHPALGQSGGAKVTYMRAADAEGTMWPEPQVLLQRSSGNNCYVTGAAVIEDRPMFVGDWYTYGTLFGIQR